jgi:peptidyl-tRNA hydrolase, PTH2 family
VSRTVEKTAPTADQTVILITEDPSAAEALPAAEDENKLYCYAIARRDLEMPPGKLSAQTGHAYTDTLCKALDNPETARRFWDYRRGNGGSKVTLLAKNEAALHRILAEADAAGIPAALITDEGHILLPHFDGSRVVTAVGVGPCTKAECRHFLKKYRAA